MTKSKHINARKKRTASEKAGFRCLKTTLAGGDAVKALAKELYSEYKDEHNAAGIYRPSARVAVDYLLSMAKYYGVKEMSTVSIKKNIWLEIGVAPLEEI